MCGEYFCDWREKKEGKEVADLDRRFYRSS